MLHLEHLDMQVSMGMEAPGIFGLLHLADHRRAENTINVIVIGSQGLK